MDGARTTPGRPGEPRHPGETAKPHAGPLWVRRSRLWLDGRPVRGSEFFGRRSPDSRRRPQAWPSPSAGLPAALGRRNSMICALLRGGSSAEPITEHWPGMQPRSR